MNAKLRKLCWLSWLLIPAILLVIVSAWAGGLGAVPDSRLVGQWHGQDRFFGMSYQEIKQKTVAIQDVETVVTIAADGSVSGRVGGAELSGCKLEANRGWLGRRLHIKTDFIIRGKLVGAVVPGSAGGTHSISAPFNLIDSRISGTLFVLPGGWRYPYPILRLRLSQ